jgi:hypothetical protein
MRERAQASVETIALMAAVLALAGALALGAARLGPPLAASIGAALAGAYGGETPVAPGLDPFERLLVASATGADADGATLLDLRTSLRARLGDTSGDAAFAATLRPLVVRVLAAESLKGTPGDIRIVDREAEDSWLRERFHPGALSRLKEFALAAAGKPGAVVEFFRDTGVGPRVPEAIEPGHATGDVVVEIEGGLRAFVLRRRPDDGLVVVASQAVTSTTGGTQR